jgi:hypothetical protein
MSNVPGEYNDWTIYEGSRFTVSVMWPGIDTTVGYTARMDIRKAKSPTATAILQLTSADFMQLATETVDTVDYLVIGIDIPASETKRLAFGLVSGAYIGYYDIEIVPPTGEDYTFRALEGTINYSREVTAAEIPA